MVAVQVDPVAGAFKEEGVWGLRHGGWGDEVGGAVQAAGRGWAFSGSCAVESAQI